jgi:predicted HTH transcriptional regulator
MEHVIVKTVCGFLNAEGGSLIVGVDDDSNVLGLELDYATLGSKGNRDGMELWLRQHLDNNLSVATAGVVKVGFDSVNGLDVCTVSVAASGRPVFAKPNEGGADSSEFWVRDGNATKQLHGDDMVLYQQDHWG